MGDLRRISSTPHHSLSHYPKWVWTKVSSYPLLLWVHITNAKVVLLQQAVVVANVVNKELPFGLPLQRKHI